MTLSYPQVTSAFTASQAQDMETAVNEKLQAIAESRPASCFGVDRRVNEKYSQKIYRVEQLPSIYLNSHPNMCQHTITLLLRATPQLGSSAKRQQLIPQNAHFYIHPLNPVTYPNEIRAILSH
jgi:hypothetical protein